jgi:hypothetical protein
MWGLFPRGWRCCVPALLTSSALRFSLLLGRAGTRRELNANTSSRAVVSGAARTCPGAAGIFLFALLYTKPSTTTPARAWAERHHPGVVGGMSPRGQLGPAPCSRAVGLGAARQWHGRRGRKRLKRAFCSSRSGGPRRPGRENSPGSSSRSCVYRAMAQMAAARRHCAAGRVYTGLMYTKPSTCNGQYSVYAVR